MKMRSALLAKEKVISDVMPTLVTIYGSSLSVLKYYQLIEDKTEEVEMKGTD